MDTIMNTKIAALAAASLALASCAPGHTEFQIAGDNSTPGGGCLWTPTTTALWGAGALPVGWQNYFYPNAQIHYFMALSVESLLDVEVQETANGTPIQTTGVNDAQVTEIDATFSTDGNGPTLPSVAVPATGWVPGPGAGVALFDLMSAATSEALISYGKGCLTSDSETCPKSDFTLIATITVKAVTGGSSVQFSNPFQFPISVTFEAPYCPSGELAGSTADLAGTNWTSCGQIQDAVALSCPDGGA